MGDQPRIPALENASTIDEESLFAPEPVQEQDAPSSIPEAARHYAPLIPSILGLAFARSALIIGSYGSYAHTDEGLITDGAMLAALAFLAIGMIIITLRKSRLKKSTVRFVCFACIVLEALSLGALAGLTAAGLATVGSRPVLSVLCTASASGAIFCWLRRAIGATTTSAAVYVFSALAASEVLIYPTTFTPAAVGYAIATVYALAQIPCVLAARKRPLASEIKSPTISADFFGFTKTMLSSKKFLVATTGGIATLSIVIGLLRGYPDGDPIPFTPITRALYGALVIVLCVIIVELVLERRRRILTVGIFVLMELMACVALLCYTALPAALDVGALFTTTLNALMVAFTWYIIIAFMSYGWRDPYYYSIAAWLVWLGSRAIARIALLQVHELSSNDLFVCAAVGTMVVISTLVVFVQFLSVARFEMKTEEEQMASNEQSSSKNATISKLMSLDEHESLADIRKAAMRHNAEEMGKQFLLSEREVDVLALYALGWTQKRVAEELYISPGTAHAHIKRIYAKTGMHSRQEVLDYLQKYTS